MAERVATTYGATELHHRMRLEPLALEGAYLLVPEPIGDERGAFARVYDQDMLSAVGLETAFPEWSVSYNLSVGTVRGLHWQADPAWEVKLVQSVRGAIFDVIVDLRPDSPGYGQWAAAELTQDNRHMLYCPKGFAHGFQTLCDHAEVYYHISERYRAGDACGVRWNDPDIGIAWPLEGTPIISPRDADLPLLAQISASS